MAGIYLNKRDWSASFVELNKKTPKDRGPHWKKHDSINSAITVTKLQLYYYRPLHPENNKIWRQSKSIFL